MRFEGPFREPISLIEHQRLLKGSLSPHALTARIGGVSLASGWTPLYLQTRTRFLTGETYLCCEPPRVAALQDFREGEETMIDPAELAGI